jgi:hypothetical protein
LTISAALKAERGAAETLKRAEGCPGGGGLLARLRAALRG